MAENRNKPYIGLEIDAVEFLGIEEVEKEERGKFRITATTTIKRFGKPVKEKIRFSAAGMETEDVETDEKDGSFTAFLPFYTRAKSVLVRVHTVSDKTPPLKWSKSQDLPWPEKEKSTKKEYKLKVFIQRGPTLVITATTPEPKGKFTIAAGGSLDIKSVAQGQKTNGKSGQNFFEFETGEKRAIQIKLEFEGDMVPSTFTYGNEIQQIPLIK
jgi:hypothetical protein